MGKALHAIYISKFVFVFFFHNEITASLGKVPTEKEAAPCKI